MFAEKSWCALWGNNVKIIDSPATVSRIKCGQARMPNLHLQSKFFDEKQRSFFVALSARRFCVAKFQGGAFFVEERLKTLRCLFARQSFRKEKEKSMKRTKLLTWILAVVLALTAICFVACDDKPVSVELEGLKLPKLKDNEVAVVIKNGEKDFDVLTMTLNGEKTGEEVVAKLVADGKLTVDWTDSSYGKWLNGIGSLKPDASKKEFVSVMTSVEKDYGTGAGVSTYTIGDVKLVTSAVGISQMTVESGAVIYFEIQTY